MKLNVLERLLLGGVIPAEGNLVTLKLIRQLREDLSFTAEEHKHFGFVEEGEKIKWNPEYASEEKEIEINDVMLGVIKNQLKQMDKAEKLTENHLSLWEKFMEK